MVLVSPFESAFRLVFAFSVASCIISSSFFSWIFVLTSSKGFRAVRTYVVVDKKIDKINVIAVGVATTFESIVC